MNYDPIHDTYTAPDPVDPSYSAASPPLQPVNAAPLLSEDIKPQLPIVPQGQSLQVHPQYVQPPPQLHPQISVAQPLPGLVPLQPIQPGQIHMSQNVLNPLQGLDPSDEKLLLDPSLAVRPSANANLGVEIDSPEVELGMLPPNFRFVSKGFKHLKKSDGEPFWRKDIQYEFLHELFTDKLQVFTNSFPHCEVPNAANGPKLTFAELYVRTLAESLKSSKVLRERLIKDTEMGIAVSKVCLLVNAGRMNTTVNFVPDMRSALRTYHLIPSLQTDKDGQTKPLQDTPRLKTILKAVCDGQDHLQTLLDLLRDPPQSKPNTNIIKLIFLMSTFFQNIPFHYDDSYDHDSFLEKLRFIKASPGPQNKFMEFFLNDEIYPANRARRFLWLMYTYLETSFTAEELEKNPFNPKLIPPIEFIPDAEVASHDIDLDFEVEYAIKMYHTRMLHLHEDVNNTNPKRGNKSKRERLKIRKQLSSEELLRPTTQADDEMEDLMVDDTLHGDDAESADEIEQTEEQARPNYIQKYVADRVKRKKPTPSVGSLVDENKKPLDAEMRWVNPEFPIAGLPDIVKKYAVCTTDIEVQPLTRDSLTSTAKRRVIANKSKGYVSQVSKVTPDFAERREEYLKWMHRYFQYKKDTGNGLLGIEWEDLRSDLVNGVEAYLYQQKGKMLVNHHYDEQMEEERYENGEPELLKRENFVTGIDVLPGDSSPVDIGSIDKIGSGYVAVHDFNNANERTTYEHLLITLVDELIKQNGLMCRSKPHHIKFDLENETLTML